MTTTFYWKGKPNFGDLLGPLLLKHFSDLDTTWSQPENAEIVTVGSLLQILPKNFAGIIAGSGKLFPETSVNFSSANIIGLRGPLSAKGVKGDICIGDPGILASELVPLPDKEYSLGLLPHWSDTELVNRPEFKQFKPLIINPADDPLKVISQIGSCRKLVTSSLHGVIVADSFGIPRRTEFAKRFEREGGTFKFLDYNSTVGVNFEIGLTQVAPRHHVTDLQHNVYDMFLQIESMFK